MKYTFLLLITVGLFGGSALAQGKWGEDGEIENTEIVIEKNRKIQLPEALRFTDKINFPIKPSDPAVQKYNYSDFKLNLPDRESKVKVLSVAPDSGKVLPQGYLKASGGNLGTAYLEGWYGSRQTDKYAFGAHIKHFSSQKGPVSTPPSGNSENRADLFSKYFLPKAVLTGNLNYSRNAYNFYGYTPAAEVNKDSSKQIFSSIGFNIGLASFNDSSKFQYNTSLGFTSFKNRYDASETRLDLAFNGTYAVNEKSGIALNSELMLSKYQDSATTGRNLFNFSPFWYYRHKHLNVQAGVNLSVQSADSAPHIYPHLNLDYAFIQTRMVGFIGVTGSMQKQTYQSMAAANPYLAPDQVLQNTNKMLELSTGLRGTEGNFSWLARIAFLNVRNLSLFVNNFGFSKLGPNAGSGPDSSRFIIAYDKGTAGILQSTVQAGYNLPNKFWLNAQADFYNYSLSQVMVGYTKLPEEAYHLPALKTALNAGIYLGPKFKLNTGLYLQQGIKAFTPNKTESEYTLPVTADWSLGAEYLFSPNLGVFAQAYNLLNQQNRRYYNYSTQPLLLLGGLSLRF